MKAKIVQLDWTDANEVTLLENGTAFFPALCEAIDQAQHSVQLETYIFKLDRTGRHILETLLRACRRGVKVRVVIDGFGSADDAEKITLDVTQAGGQCLVFRPEPKRLARWVFTRQRLRRLHRKIAVVDGEVAFVGGINIIDDYDDLEPGNGGPEVPRFDYAVAVRGPMVDHAVRAQQWLWLRLHWGRLGSRSRGWRRLKPNIPTANVVLKDKPLRAALVLRDNLRYRRTFEQAYLYGLEHAQHEILIANAYFLPGKPFRRALINAKRRGVRVRVLVQGKVEYHMQYHATRALYAPLLAAGIEIYEYMPSFLHAKVAVIDAIAAVGSSNIDPFSFLLAREANVLLDDARFAGQLQHSLERAIHEGGTRICADAYHSRGWIRRFVDACAYRLVRMGIAVAGAPSEY